MTKAEIAKQYDIDEFGRISSPGKFEREMYYAVHFWAYVLDGVVDDETWDEYGVQVSIFDIDTLDIEQFPELEGNTTLKIWENDNGFVFCEVE